MFEREETYSGCSRQVRPLRGGGVHPKAYGMRRRRLYKESVESISGIWEGSHEDKRGKGDSIG